VYSSPDGGMETRKRGCAMGAVSLALSGCPGLAFAPYIPKSVDV